MVIFYHTSISFYPNGQSLYDLVYHMLCVFSEKNGKKIAVVKIVINGISGICNNSSVYCAKVLACLKGTCTEMCPTLAKGCKCVCNALEDLGWDASGDKAQDSMEDDTGDRREVIV